MYFEKGQCAVIFISIGLEYIVRTFRNYIRQFGNFKLHETMKVNIENQFNDIKIFPLHQIISFLLRSIDQNNKRPIV